MKISMWSLMVFMATAFSTPDPKPSIAEVGLENALIRAGNPKGVARRQIAAR